MELLTALSIDARDMGLFNKLEDFTLGLHTR
jgi:hypothetical protein